MPFAELSDVVARASADGICSVWLGPLEGEAWWIHEPDALHYAASTMKLALVTAAYRQHERGVLDLDARIVVRNEFSSRVDAPPYELSEADDSDAEVWRRLGQPVGLRWLALRAIVRSSNLASNLLLDVVGIEAVRELLADEGCDRSIVDRGIEDVAARDAGYQNLITARDLATQLQALTGDVILSAASTADVLGMLAAQQIADAIPTGLPSGVEVAHKSGWIEGVSHDGGIVRPPAREPYIFVMCTTTSLPDRDATELIGRTARAAWNGLEGAA